jgi:hypothetical protein
MFVLAAKNAKNTKKEVDDEFGFYCNTLCDLCGETSSHNTRNDKEGTMS